MQKLRLPYDITDAWVLNNVVPFEHSIPFANPSGAVTWARLPNEIILNVEEALQGKLADRR